MPFDSKLNDSSHDDDYIDLNPDPSCLIESIRDIGYSLETAIADIIDNSISAEANNIKINIDFNEKKNDFILEIIDDGFGMNREELIEACNQRGIRVGNMIKKPIDGLADYHIKYLIG